MWLSTLARDARPCKDCCLCNHPRLAGLNLPSLIVVAVPLPAMAKHESLMMGGSLRDASWAAQGLWAGQPASQVGSSPLQTASQVAAVLVHPRLGLAVLQRIGTAHWDAVQSMPIGRLSAADAAAARQLLSLRVLRLDGPGRGPAIAPLHTGLHFWAGQGARWGSLCSSCIWERSATPAVSLQQHTEMLHELMSTFC